jgi:predicted Fe-Mo cluster-binding NifX family protein
MMICITAQGRTLDTPAEERFGRAPYFIIIETETSAFEALENKFAAGAGGVGPKAAQLLIDRGVKALVSGQVGGNAREVLIAADIAMYAYRGNGTVRDAFEQFLKNILKRVG